MKKNKFILIAATVCCGLVVGGVCINPTTNLFKASTALDNLERSFDHSDASRIEFDGSNATLKDGSATYVFTGASASTSGFVNLADGGTLSKDQAKGLKTVKVTFTGNLTLKTGFNAEELCFSYSLTSGEAETIRGNYFKIVATGAVEISKLELSYNCLNEEAESHNLEANYTYDDEYHWKNCTDSHCSHQEKTRHEYKVYGFNKTYTDKPQSFDTEFECNYCEQPKITNTFVRKDIDGKIALASGFGGGSSYGDLGSGSGSYAADAGLTGFTKIGDQIASVYQFNKRVSPQTDGTGKNSSFRLMSGYDITSGAHQYNFTFKNLGDKTLTFDVYNRSGKDDTSDLVNPLNVVIKPNEVINAKYVYSGSSNGNILTYFRFADDNYIGQKLAIDLHLLNTVEPVEVTMTNALFTGDVATREYQYGTKMSSTDFSTSDVVGVNNNGTKITLDEYVLTDDVTLEATFKPTYVTSGTGLLDYAKGHDSTHVGAYGPNSISKLGHSYIGDEYATLLAVKGVNGAATSDGCGYNASFRTLTDYSVSGGMKLKYTIKNLGTTQVKFELYHRINSSDSVVTNPIDSVIFDLAAGEVSTQYVIYSTSSSNRNLLTYYKALSDFNCNIAVIAEVITNGYKVTLVGGPTFSDGSTKDVLANNATPSITNIATYEGYSHSGWVNSNNVIASSSATYKVHGVHESITPYYDCSYISSISSTFGKYDFGDFHSSGRRGSFATKMITKTDSAITNDMVEKGMRLSYSDAISSGSTFIIIKSGFAISSGTTSFKIRVQNLKSVAVEFDLYQVQNSGSAFLSNHKIGTIALAANETNTFEFSYGMYQHDTLMLGYSFENELSSGMDVVMTCYLKK